MRAIDELHLEYPFLGARQLRKILAREGHPHAGRLHISTLMAKMGITALYRKSNTSKRQRSQSGRRTLPRILQWSTLIHRALRPNPGQGIIHQPNLTDHSLNEIRITCWPPAHG